MRRIERFFLWSVVAILLITAMAKMVTVWGVVSTPTEPDAVKTMLEDREPFFNLVPFRLLLLLAAWLEVSVVLILFSKASSLIKWNAVTYLCVLFYLFQGGALDGRIPQVLPVHGERVGCIQYPGYDSGYLYEIRSVLPVWGQLQFSGNRALFPEGTGETAFFLSIRIISHSL